jgi:hypothetical protein
MYYLLLQFRFWLIYCGKKDIMAFYERTGNGEALRLLCFFPGALPETLDPPIETAESTKAALNPETQNLSLRNLDGHDWKYHTKAQRIGICLLALAKANSWDARYEPLVRPYHPIAHFSGFPVALLKELLAQTSEGHRNKIEAEFQIRLDGFAH